MASSTTQRLTENQKTAINTLNKVAAYIQVKCSLDSSSNDIFTIRTSSETDKIRTALSSLEIENAETTPKGLSFETTREQTKFLATHINFIGAAALARSR